VAHLILVELMAVLYGATAVLPKRRRVAELSNLINAVYKVCGKQEVKAIAPLRLISSYDKGHEKFTNSHFLLNKRVW
jgi:hypothetical protein